MTNTPIVEYTAEREHLLARIAELEAQLARRTERLSPAEIRVLRLVACGMDYINIGRKLHIGERTIRGHMRQIYKKTGTTNRVQAARYAWRHGYVDIDEAWQIVEKQEWGER